MLAFSSFPLAFYLLMRSTAAQNSEITCPDIGFAVGVNATVTCKVNKADFDSACTLPASLITFYFTPSNGSKTEWCSSSYATCPNTGTTQPVCGTCSCGCEANDTTFLTHRLEFIPISAYASGSFSCEVICFHSGSLPTLTNNYCDQVKVASPKPPGQGSDLIWLLLLLLLLIPPLILIIIFCCPCGNIACHWCCCTGRCYCPCADKAGTGCCGAAWCKKEDNFISHVCYLCGYKKVKEEEEFICCSLEKCEVVPTTRSGQRDNKVDADHVATNGARNRERVSTPVQETELTKVRETSSPPSGEEETSPNGSVRALPMPKVPVAAPSSRLPPLHSSTLMTSVERNSQVLDEPHNSRPLPLPGIKSTKM